MKWGLIILLASLVFNTVLGNQNSTTLNWTDYGPVYGLGSQKAYYPTVQKINGVYNMWYGSGNNANLGYATSTDGIHWTNNGDVNGSATYIYYHSKVLFDDNKFGNATGHKYKIWFWNYPVSVYSLAINYAESDDGINWVNVQSITQDTTNFLVDPASTSTDCGNNFCGTYGPFEVIYNSSASNTGSNPFSYSYVMYFDAYQGVPTQENTGLAYSADGKRWTRYGSSPVLSASGIVGEWDSQYVTASSVVHYGNAYNLWYGGGVLTNNEGIGYAISCDGINWVKVIENPLFSTTDGVNYRNSRAYTPFVIEDNGVYKMWYSCKGDATAYGGDASDYAICYATAPANPLLTLCIETSCSDGIDNDGDGLVDCADTSDCATGTTCATGICCSGVCTLVSCSNDAGCDDSNACTIDICNNAGTCSSSCSNTVITSCIGGDGCCASGCSFANDADCLASCGNSVCEAGETCANCPGDCVCGLSELCCSGSCVNPCDVNTDCSDSNSCTTDVCNYAGTCNFICAYTTISSCTNSDSCCPSGCTLTNDNDCGAFCGNGVCESGETCTSCASDCLSTSQVCCSSITYNGDCCSDSDCNSDSVCSNYACTLKEIAISVLNPLVNQSFNKGSLLEIKAGVTINSLIGRNVDVIASGFFGNLTLYDDGNHNDDLAGDGNYANSINISKDTPTGSQEIMITARKDTGYTSSNSTINVIDNIIVTINTGRSAYEKGDELVITGTVKNLDNKLVSSGKVNLKFNYSQWVTTASINITNGVYEYKDIISFSSPEGEWDISAIALDEYNNKGNASAKLNISLPSAVKLQYNLQILSPVEGTKYTRGEKILVSVKILKGEAIVENANVSFINPNGNRVSLESTTSGLYVGEYIFDWDDMLGEWSVSIDGQKLENSELIAGGTYLNVKIEPANLKVDITDFKEKVYSNDEATLTASIFYPDGAPVSGANIAVLGPENQIIKLEEVSVGIYNMAYLVNDNNTGVWSFVIEGKDQNLNIVKSEQLSVIITKRSPLQELINNFINSLAITWWMFIILIAVIATASRKLLIKKGNVKKDYLIKDELKKIHNLKIETEKKYFTEGSISQDVFNDLISNYSKREAELKSKELDLKSKKTKKH